MHKNMPQMNGILKIQISPLIFMAGSLWSCYNVILPLFVSTLYYVMFYDTMYGCRFCYITWYVALHTLSHFKFITSQMA